MAIFVLETVLLLAFVMDNLRHVGLYKLLSRSILQSRAQMADTDTVGRYHVNLVTMTLPCSCADVQWEMNII